MSDAGSPIASPGNERVNDGQEKEYEDALAAADSDRESDALSEVDEDQIEDYDPEAANIENRPVDIDEDVARTLKATKRKRAEGETAKKPREGRREKKRRDKDEDVDMMDDGGDSATTARKPRRARRAAADGDVSRKEKAASPEKDNEDDLSPEEKRKRAIDRALDAAIKKPSGARRRKKDEIVSRYTIFHQLMGHKITNFKNRTWKMRLTIFWRTSRSRWNERARTTTRLVRMASQHCTSSSSYQR